MKLIKTKLGNLLNVKRGASLSGEYYSDSGDKIRLTLGNFNYPGGGFKNNSSKDNIYFTGPIKDEFIMHKGDIITPLTEQVAGLLGETARIPEDKKYIQSGDIGLVIPNESKIDNSFAYYLLSSPMVKKQLGAGAQQTKIRHTSPDKIKDCEVWIPSLPYQHKAGKVLDYVNAKISNNNVISAQLESLAKTIYDYWFLQFEFPNEEGKPYKSSGGKMVWNEELKIEIPENFSVVDIKTVCNITDCLHSKKPERHFESDKWYMLESENITKDGYIDVSDKYYISKEDYDIWSNKIEIRENDFVVTNAGRAGDIGKIPHGITCAIGRNITAIRPFNINPYYLRQFFKSDYFQKQVSSNLDSGSFFKSFNVKSIKKIKILMPNKNVYAEYNKIVEPIIMKSEQAFQETQHLISLRDFLLPLLMNGQVTFKDDVAPEEE